MKVFLMGASGYTGAVVLEHQSVSSMSA